MQREEIAGLIERLRHECAKSGLHDHDGCSCKDAELLASLSARCEELERERDDARVLDDEKGLA